MAPVDRRQHRQQRVRGAGPSSVQASFGFNFGAFGARPAKQTSLPPQSSSRRTPVQRTPRGANGSAQRHRSASVQRSGASKRKSTPSDKTVTPHLGKRKRGSTTAEPGAGEGEEDELSPGQQEAVRSVEMGRRVIGTVSPMREQVDDAPDELSVLDEGDPAVRDAVFGKSARTNRTPVQIPTAKPSSSASARQRTPTANRAGDISVTSRQSIARRSKSTDPVTVTPSLLPNGRPRPSASRAGSNLDTAGTALDGESEDELSPQANGATPRVVGRTPQSTVQEEAALDVEDELSPQANGATPRVVGRVPEPSPVAQEETAIDVDELSSPMQPTTVENTPVTKATVLRQHLINKEPEQATAAQPAKRGRAPRVVLDEEDYASPAVVPSKPIQRGRPRKDVATKAVKAKQRVTERDRGKDVQVDELSPDHDRITKQSTNSLRRKEDVMEISSAQEDSDAYEEPEPEEEPELTPRPVAKRHSPKQVAQRVKPSTGKPPRKRQKFLGPKHAISVMRIKGSAVRGITVADTTRTILEETIDHRLSRMAEKLQTTQDSNRRKELRSEINLSLSFKESLDEKLLDLQDANDVLSTNFKKMKLFRRDNAELRKEILGLQNDRQDVAIEQDEVQAEFDAEKAKVDARNTLSDNMFEIEAAIQSGRDRAFKEGREDEGPQIPLRMLLETVAQDVGSLGGGLLAHVRGFNGLLERAAGWLEGRA
ncbi:hypothetical protein BDW02DRAFT_644322 [Decorospora gaudefroyi]|uniref:Inner kinetochore subunit AME1 domain-containing protein n=1 Tax=Decorospora gaudefroyi TaxID=184978 RepID=A0A6A5KNH8_9PLEO|nr:hypothetical protein BDW02DRAFT_644322 [Decorospora gaudefroyi]